MVNIFLKKYPAFKNGVYSRFVLSQVLSLTGGFIQNVALSALIAEIGGQKQALGIFLCISYLPVFLLSYPASRLVTKLPVKAILIVTEAMLFLLSGYLAFRQFSSVFGIYLFGGVWGTVRAFQTPAAASVTKLVCTDSELQSGVAGYSLCQSLSRAAGPLIAGALYTRFSYFAAFLVNTLSYIPSFILLLTLKIKPMQKAKKQKPKIIIPLFSLVAVISLCGTAYNLVFTGVSQKLSLSKTAFAIFMACVGVGTVIGALILGNKKQVLIAGAGIPVMLLLLSVAKSGVFVGGVAVMYGVCDYLFFTSALRRINADNDKNQLPAAMGVYTALTTGALPLGYLLLTYIVTGFGINAALYVCAFVISIGYLVFFAKSR